MLFKILGTKIIYKYNNVSFINVIEYVYTEICFYITEDKNVFLCL